MCAAPRFTEPTYNRRPYGCHRYDVFSPKLQRRVTLFGKQSLGLWTTLEASSQVLSYCERPQLVPDAKPIRAFDFWVKRKDGEEFLLLLRPGEKANATGVALLADSVVLGALVRCVDPDDLAEHAIALNNWGVIIRDLGAFERFIPLQLSQAIKSNLGAGKSIMQLQKEHGDSDSSLVKLAIYSLLHKGLARSPQLGTEVLGPAHLIEPA
ncbi:hypothetical protein KY495_20440 [Massilia sp. PAMC28688]|uniref:hypothetical protein n=1 Tax=Massilia sp. PAMC28688 TaxID=2861283 RepID=UPI001C62B2F7|nr:hypothetical protein [Massilia sp. PAMC28688]QYF93041.1 hypothetical protein KY495_20440 [Massilia sp. PAMC28688]